MSLRSLTTTSGPEAAMSTSNKIVSIPFDGKSESYTVWATRIRAAFKARDWWYLIDKSKEEERKKDSTSTTMEKDQAAAYASLVTSLPDALVASYACDTDEDPASL